MGLTSLGIGLRYAALHTSDEPIRVRLTEMDRSLVFILVFSACVTVIGLGIAFFGLAYHHARREREFHWEREKTAAQQRTTV
jgi:uncharacterized membrane protein YjgN (DUF898 family)